MIVNFTKYGKTYMTMNLKEMCRRYGQKEVCEVNGMTRAIYTIPKKKAKKIFKCMMELKYDMDYEPIEIYSYLKENNEALAAVFSEVVYKK